MSSAEYSPHPSADAGPAKLKLIDAITQSVGFLGPVFSASIVLILLIAGASGKTAGAAAPLSVVIATVGIVALGWIVAQYAKKIHSAGSLYNYVSVGLGVRVGAAAGYIYYLGIILLGAAVSIYFGGYVHDTVDAEFHHGVFPIWLWQLLVLVLVLAVSYVGVRVSIKTQLALAAISFAVLTVFFVYLIVKVGSDNSVKAFKPSTSPDGWGGVLFGVLYGVLLFTGFETAANLGEETERPERNIPRAVLISVGIAAGFFLLATYAQVAGFKFDLNKIGAAISSGQSPLVFLANPHSAGGYGSVAVRRLLELVILLDALAVYIGVTVAASRGLFALSRDRWLPAPLASVSAKRGTPVAATATVGAAYLVWIVVSHVGAAPFRLKGAPDYFSLYQWISTAGIFSLILVYLMLAMSAPRGLADHPRRAWVLVAAVVAALLTAGAVYGSIYKVPDPGVWAAYVSLMALAVAVVIAFVVGRGRTLADLHGAQDSADGKLPALVVE